MPCGAVHCPAVRSCVVLRSAFLRAHRTRCYERYQIPGTRLYVCTRIFTFFNGCPPSQSCSCFGFRKIHWCCRSQRDIDKKQTTQHRAISSAQVALGIIQSLVAANNGLLSPAPFTFSCIVSCASAAAGVSRLRSGALVVVTTVE